MSPLPPQHCGKLEHRSPSSCWLSTIGQIVLRVNPSAKSLFCTNSETSYGVLCTHLQNQGISTKCESAIPIPTWYTIFHSLGGSYKSRYRMCSAPSSTLPRRKTFRVRGLAHHPKTNQIIKALALVVMLSLWKAKNRVILNIIYPYGEKRNKSGSRQLVLDLPRPRDIVVRFTTKVT